jgi:hypothetical protein
MYSSLANVESPVHQYKQQSLFDRRSQYKLQEVIIPSNDQKLTEEQNKFK